MATGFAWKVGSGATLSFGVGVGGVYIGALTPPSEALAVSYGNKTAASEGAIPTDGTSFSSGNSSGHWQVSSGEITPSASGASANLNAGPYNLVMNNGDEFTITVSSGYSVSTETQMKTAMQNASLAYGDIISIAPGTYNPVTSPSGTAVISRGSVASGTYSTSNTIKIKPMIALDPPTLGHLRLGSNCAGFDFDGVFVSTKEGASADGTVNGIIQLTSSNNDITIQNCTFTYGSTLTGFEFDASRAVYSPGSLRLDRFRFLNNTVTGAFNVLSALVGDDMIIDSNYVQHIKEDIWQFNKGVDVQFTNNVSTNKSDYLFETVIVDIRSDGGTGMIIETEDALPTHVSGLENIVIDGGNIDASVQNEMWNYLSDFLINTNAAPTQGEMNDHTTTGSGSVRITTVNYNSLSGWTSGGRLVYKFSHADALQIFPTNYTTNEMDGWVIEGNVFLLGVSDAQLGFNALQGGLWVDSGSGAKSKANWSIKGNVFEISGLNAMDVKGLTSAEVWSNVVLKRLGYVAASDIAVAQINVAGTGTVYDNIANQYGSMTGMTTANNVTVARNSTAYGVEFDDAPDADFDLTVEYDYTGYLPAAGTATALAGLAGWDFETGTYTGTR